MPGPECVLAQRFSATLGPAMIASWSWLKAGVSEDGQWSETKLRYAAGAVVSPLLANVYLHYVFDLWVEVWRKKVANGDVIVVRYADDLVVGFQYRTDSERFLKEGSGWPSLVWNYTRTRHD